MKGTLNWSNAANWTNGIPTSGEPGGTLLVFPSMAADRKATIDDIGGLVVDQISFTDSGYVLDGLGNNTLTLSGATSPSIIDSVGGNTFGTRFTSLALNGSTAIEIDAGTDTIAALTSGAGSLIKTGAGMLALSGINTYAGGTTVNLGTLIVGNNSALGTGTLTLGNGTLQVNTPVTLANPLVASGPITFQGTPTLGGSSDLILTGPVTIANGVVLTITNGATTTVTGVIGGTGSLVLNSPGASFALSGANTYAGGTTLIAGTLTIGSDTALGTGPLEFNTPSARPSVLQSSGPITLANPFTVVGMASVGGSNNLTLTGPGTLKASDSVSTTLAVSNTATTTFAGVLSGEGALNIGGTTVLSVANTFTGALSIFATVRLGAANAIPATSSVSLFFGTLDLNNFDTAVGSVASNPTGGAGTLALGSGTLTLGGDNQSTIFDGSITGTGGLIKVGTGTVALAGANTYTGPTLVKAGTLFLNGLQPGSNVTVSPEATFAGTGTVGTLTTAGTINPTTIASRSSPDLSASGLLTSGSATFTPGSFLVVKLNDPTPGTGYSQLRVNGTLNLSGATLSGSVVGPPLSTHFPLGTQFTIVSAAGGITGTFSGLPNNALATFNRQLFRVNYTGQSVVLTRTLALPDGTPNQRFVAQVYLDLLQRQVDASGLAAWSGLLDQAVSRFQVVLAIQSSQEYRTVVVQRLYGLLLHRVADPSGLASFVAFLSAGGTVEQVEAVIAGSPEYFQGRGGGTNDGFLSAMYQDAFNRAVDPGGRASFTQALAGGATRGQVAAIIFGSPEYRQDLVQSYYQRFLVRAADPGGLSSWVELLLRGVPDEQVIAGIIGSAEYSNRTRP